MSIDTTTTTTIASSTSTTLDTIANTFITDNNDDEEDNDHENVKKLIDINQFDSEQTFETNPADLFTESDKVNNNDKVVESLQRKLSIDSKELYDISSNWDLKTFLSKSSEQRNDVDVLIMSDAGKPIYCYSGRQDITTLMGVCVALVNFVMKTQNDNLRTIRTRNGLNINFSIRSPLVIVVVCRQQACFDEKTLINQVHAQIISTITLKKLKSIFQKAPTYDLKRIIHKNDFKTLDILIKSITTPITDLFRTYKTIRCKFSCRIFNNVISFYTSTSISTPRSLSSSGNNNVNNSSMVFFYDHKPNVLGRVYVPIAIMNPNIREQITTMINESVSINSDIVFSILFYIEDDDDEDGSNALTENFPPGVSPSEWSNLNNQLPSDDSESNDFYESFESTEDQELDSTEKNYQHQDLFSDNNKSIPQPPPLTLNNSKIFKNLKLITVCNHTAKFRINPLDIQLLYSLIKASDSLLTSTESLWIPFCLSRVDANRFLHAHISYLSKKYCLILLDVDHNNFDKCRQVKEKINFKLDQIRLAEPMTGLNSNINELNQPHLQYLCHQTPRHCIIWQASIQTEFSPLNYYVIDRMQRSSLKTLWLRSMKEKCALLGWQTATFQLYAQFDCFLTKKSALETVTSFLKWFKKEEDKLVIKEN